MSRLRRIVHATDFSSASRAGFARAIAMAKADRAQLFLVHVLTPQAALAATTCPSDRRLDAAAEKNGQRHLNASSQGAQERRGSKTLLLHGRPADRPRRPIDEGRSHRHRQSWPHGTGEAVPKQRRLRWPARAALS
jgi:nucleotide-binding universal stress UspA family protein